MDNREAVNWLINISADIGKAEHSDLWHYEQALTEIKDMLESAQLSREVTTKDTTSDTISRQAAVELAMKYCPDDDGTVQCDGDIRELLDELDNLPPAQPEQKWIPRTEQLPKKEGWYITTVESEKTGKRRIENDLFAVDIALAHGHTPNKFCKDGYRQRTVAWMPFPEPYCGGK